MNEPIHRLTLTGEQLFDERVHVNLASPVVRRYLGGQRTAVVVGSIALILVATLLLAVGATMQGPVDPSGQGSPSSGSWSVWSCSATAC